MQEGPLIVRPSELANGGDVALSLDHKVLLSPLLGAALCASGLPTEALRPVRGWKGEAVGWVQLLPTRELPPTAPGTRGLIRDHPCPACRRDGFYVDARSPLGLVYPGSVADEEPRLMAALT